MRKEGVKGQSRGGRGALGGEIKRREDRQENTISQKSREEREVRRMMTEMLMIL